MYMILRVYNEQGDDVPLATVTLHLSEEDRMKQEAHRQTAALLRAKVSVMGIELERLLTEHTF